MSNSKRRLTAWTAAGLLGTGALAGAVVSQVGFASADTAAPAPNGGVAAPQAPGPLAGHPGVRGALRDMFGAGDLGRPLCGDITVKTPKSSSGTLAVHFQNGTLGEVSGDSFSVTSEGCPKGSYAVVDGTKIIKDGVAVALDKLDTGKPVHVVKVGDTLRLVVQGRAAPGLRDHVKPGTVTNGTLTVDGKAVTVPSDAKFFKDGKEVGNLNALSGNVHVLYGKDGSVKAVVEGQRPPRPGAGPEGPGQRGPGHGRMGGPGWMGPQNGTPPSGTASSSSQTF